MDLRTWMAAHGLSNAEFAASIGVAENTVSRWRNRTRRPRAEELRRISAATKGEVTANDFYAPADHVPAAPIAAEAA